MGTDCVQRDPPTRLNRWLSGQFPNSYRDKLMAVVFCCTALPMLVFVVWLFANNGAAPERLMTATSMALAAMVLGMLVSLALICRLLAPVRRAADALELYNRQHKLPALSEIGDKDDLGRLIHGINRCLRGIDAGVRELERHARQDPLTGALNRRGSEHALADSLTLAHNGRVSFTLFVVDMDNLKPINDEFGHAAGDRALVALVESARMHLGPEGWIGRWGGDEFLIGIHAGAEEAIVVAERWLQWLATPRAGVRPVYASAGCVTYRPGDEPQQLYRAADLAMYAAKGSGARKVVVGDINAGMLFAERDRMSERGNARSFDYGQCNAASVPLGDASFEPVPIASGAQRPRQRRGIARDPADAQRPWSGPGARVLASDGRMVQVVVRLALVQGATAASYLGEPIH